jgi:hypothetical protein
MVIKARQLDRIYTNFKGLKMFPWERRLRDLARLLYNCGDTYFSPDLFRQNTNQFLQTSRTVTFIIQKNKAEIPAFDNWYRAQVLTGWAGDSVMTWAKDARNVIEKEGDLEMHSKLATSVLFSHVPSKDFIIETPRPFLIQADINKIAKLAKSSLPPGVLDAAVLQIERRWVANSLPNYELISALTYIYARLYSVCADLAILLSSTLDASIPHPTNLDPAANDVGQMRFIKLGKPNMGRLTTTRVERDHKFKPPLALVELQRELKGMPTPSSLDDLVHQRSMLAENTFLVHGNHMHMLSLFDENWKQIDYITTAFSDQADKYLFWRNAAKRAAYLKAAAIVWVGESWVREHVDNSELPIRKMPIIGEQLHVVGATVDGDVKTVRWGITRSEKSKMVSLEAIPPEHDAELYKTFFIQPILEAMSSVRPKEKTKPA